MAVSGGDIYPSALTALLSGDIRPDTKPVKAQLVAGYAFDPSHTTYSDVTGAVGTPLVVDVISVDQGALYIADLVFSAVSGVDPITAVVFHNAPPPQELICHVSRRADTIPLSLTPDGDDIVMRFDPLLKL